MSFLDGLEAEVKKEVEAHYAEAVQAMIQVVKKIIPGDAYDGLVDGAEKLVDAKLHALILELVDKINGKVG